MKIIIVDDNLSMRKVVSVLFEGQGHQVVAALEDGTALVDCVRQHAPDLVCLDQNLPGQTGLELLKILKDVSPEVDVVMMTGSTDVQLEGAAADAGAVGFLRKPFSQQQILAELDHVQETRQLVSKTSQSPDAAAPARAPVGRTAVVVDDNGSMRLLLKGILEGLGINVLQTVANGKDAVDAAARHHPAVVCLDVDMPLMSGLEALPLIVAASPQSKVVMVTGNATKDIVDRAVGGGAKGYIIKPLRPAHVEAFIRKLLP